MKNYLIFSFMMVMGVSPIFAQIEDDIYYNPKQTTSNSSLKKKKSNYIADFQNMDVDAYNLRGQYYSSPVDTIGADTEVGQDFVYTTQIQKYYNPTIVVDNADLLSDILEDAYGNVNVEFNINGIPSFGPYYAWLPSRWNNLYFDMTPGWSISWGWGNPWWGSSLSWSWGPGWGYGPSWAWSPAWSWGPSWSWSWGPTWGPGWGPSPGWGWGPSWRPPRPYYADYRPGGNRPVGAHPGWQASTRPGGNFNGNRPVGHSNGYSRPGTASTGRPGSAQTRPGNNVNTGGHRQSGQGAFTTTSGNHNGNRDNTGGIKINPNRGTGNSSVNTGGHRTSGQGAFNTNNSNRTTTTHRESTTTNSTRRNSNSSSGSFRSSGSSRGMGGSSGGHRTSGGGSAGRGGHR